jgi:hypothetical protein
MEYTMKKLLIPLLFAVLSSGCASTISSPVSTQVVEEKLEVPGTKLELFNKSLDWTAQHYNDSKSVIEVRDSERGKIIGRGVLLIESSMGLRKDYYSYTLQIDIKDNKVRIKMNNIAPYAGINGVSDPSYFMDEIIAELNSTAKLYFTSIKSETDDNEW